MLRTCVFCTKAKYFLINPGRSSSGLRSRVRSVFISRRASSASAAAVASDKKNVYRVSEGDDGRTVSHAAKRSSSVVGGVDVTKVRERVKVEMSRGEVTKEGHNGEFILVMS